MVNKVILVGNLGADPEVRSFESGSKMARFSVATSERIFNRATNQYNQHTEWHSVVVWRELADVADKYLRKGSQVYLEGKIRSREQLDSVSGNSYKVVEVLGSELKILGRRADTASASATTATKPQPDVVTPKIDPDNIPF